METAVKQLSQEEGFKTTVYQDSLGYWTIGVGICVDARVKGAGLTEDEIQWLLQHRTIKLAAQIRDRLPWLVDLDEARFSVLLGMAFQMGLEGLLSFKNTLRSIERGDYETAAHGMLLSKWATQTPGRAKRMAEQMRTGEWQPKEGFTLP